MPATRTTAQRRVLCVEPDPDLGREMRVALEALGFGVEIDAGGERAAERAATLRPALAILSVELPRGSGFAICAALRRNPATRHTPVILVAGAASAGAIEQHRRLRTRADGYLLRPFPMTDLTERVAALVGVDDDAGLDEDLAALARPTAAPIDAVAGPADAGDAFAGPTDAGDTADATAPASDASFDPRQPSRTRTALYGRAPLDVPADEIDLFGRVRPRAPAGPQSPPAPSAAPDAEAWSDLQTRLAMAEARLAAAQRAREEAAARADDLAAEIALVRAEAERGEAGVAEAARADRQLAEEAEGRVAALRAERDRERAEHARRMQEAEAERDRLRRESDQRADALRAEFERAQADLRGRLAEVVASRDLRIGEVEAELHARWAARVDAAQAERDQTRAETAERVAALRADLARGPDRHALEILREQAAEIEEDLRGAREQATAHEREELAARLAEAERAREELAARLAEAERAREGLAARLAEAERALSDAHGRMAELSGRVQGEEESVQRARQAMALAITALDKAGS